MNYIETVEFKDDYEFLENPVHIDRCWSNFPFLIWNFEPLGPEEKNFLWKENLYNFI